MKRGVVWWVAFDPAVGSEIRKTRPAVIVRNDAANRQLARVIVVPLTSNTARQYPGEAIVTVGGQRNKAMADQIMAADLVKRTNCSSVEDLRVQNLMGHHPLARAIAEQQGSPCVAPLASKAASAGGGCRRWTQNIRRKSGADAGIG